MKPTCVYIFTAVLMISSLPLPAALSQTPDSRQGLKSETIKDSTEENSDTAALLTASLFNALWTGKENSAIKLIKQGADVKARDEKNRTPLHAAANSNLLKAADLLIKRGAEVNAADWLMSTPLCNASYEGHLEMVALLIKNKADINARAAQGNTPLTYAIYNNNKAIIAYLRKKGAKDGRDDRKFIEALQNEDMDGIINLLPLITSINMVIDYGETPLLYSISHNKPDIAILLIKNGADVNAKDASGQTPLHLAVYSRNYDIVRLLLEKGAYADVKDNEGKTPFDIAEELRDSGRIIELLKKYGAAK